MRYTIAYFKLTIASESIIERDPTIDKSFRRAWTFEVFVERGLRQHVGVCPAHAVHFKRRQVIFIAELIDKVNLDQFIGWCGGRDSGTCRGRCSRDRGCTRRCTSRSQSARL